MKNLYKNIFAFIVVSFVLNNKAQAETDYYLYLPKVNDSSLPDNPEGQKFSFKETNVYEIYLESVQEDQIGIIYKEDGSRYITWGYYDRDFGNYIPIGNNEDLSQGQYFRFPYYMKDITIQIEEKGTNNLSMTVKGTSIPFIFGNWNTETNWKYNNNDYNRLLMDEGSDGDWYGKLEPDFNDDGGLKSFRFKFESDIYGAEFSNNVNLNLANEDVHIAYKEYNSMYPKGYFYYAYSEPVYIKLHFNDDGTATFVFSREPLYPERFVWKDADGNEIKMNEEGKYHHKTTFGKDNNGVTLDNADSYDYVIKYREPANNPPVEEISLLDLSEENTDSERDDDGYRDASGNEFSINQGTINFNAAGNYKITHETQKDAPTLYVTVAQAEAVVHVGENLYEEFNPSNNNYTWDKAISFTNNKESDSSLITNITTSDFNVSITPQSEGSWVKLENYSADLNLEEAYEAALIPDIYEQYSKLVSQDNQNNDVYIDGFFSELAAPTVTEVPEGSGLFSLTQIFPCSGVYEVTISSNPQGNYIFKDETTTITITPNLYGMFGNTPGFNINGYGFTRDSQTILYPTDEANDKLLKNSVAYKPGTYFDSEFSIVVNNPDGSNVDPDDNSQLPINETLAQNTNWINFDFSALAETSGIGVKVTVIKNGAKGEYNFTVEKNADIPTAVENIEAGETGDAVYYNLQGVPVLNPDHGIYIRITNGKAEKIVM